MSVYQTITNRIIEALEQGVVPWQKNWQGFGPSRNFATGHVYRGINALMTQLSPHPLPYFLTFRQVKALGGSVNKGAKSLPILFWKVLLKDASGQSIPPAQAQEREDLEKRFIGRLYRVFNIAYCSGIDYELPERPELDPIPQCEALLEAIDDFPQIQHGGDHALYQSAQDQIRMPLMQQFQSAEAYYATLWHEVVHSTGHAQRLSRKGIVEPTKFGSDLYAEEELIAEIGTAYLCNHCGIETKDLIDNTHAYLQGWLTKLQSDTRFIFRAANEAQKAVEYLLPPAE
ncbi:MAG: zincin-like metallopeptidase domain-containing protein [Bacteroidota bacterium]